MPVNVLVRYSVMVGENMLKSIALIATVFQTPEPALAAEVPCHWRNIRRVLKDRTPRAYQQRRLRFAFARSLGFRLLPMISTVHMAGTF